MGKPQELRVVSDGTPYNTVITGADGKKIEGVRSATVWLEAGDYSRLTLEIYIPKVDIHAHPSVITFICACCGDSVDHECVSRNTLGA